VVVVTLLKKTFSKIFDQEYVQPVMK